LPVSECRRFELELYPFLETNYNGLLKSLREKKAFDDAIKAEAKKALDEFKEQFKARLEAEKEQVKEKEEATGKDQAPPNVEKAEAKADASAHPPPQTPEKANAPAS
jgi:peptidoglycan hydrolase CwlO-like protein